MKKLVKKGQKKSVMNKLAMAAARTSLDSACLLFMHQPKVPAELNRLRNK
ncbi:MAG: cyclic lactone autoinducer peptide [Oscillospiraceae bacterium]